MLNVVLDTNILHRAQNFSSTEIRKLIQLAQDQVIRILIPEVVLREFKSQKEAECKKLISVQEENLSLLRKIAYSRNDNTVLSKMTSNFSSIKDSLLTSFEQQLNNFITLTNLQIVKNSPNDLDKMWDLYFAGDLPFKKEKNRSDIPDCFIYLAIKSIPVPHTICNDNALKTALEKDGLPVYESIDDFIDKNKKLLKQLKTYKTLQKESQKIINFLLQEIGTIKKLMINQLEKRLEYETFTDEKMESENNEGSIEGAPSISEEDITIDEKSIGHDGHGFFSFDFECVFQNLVEYYIYKADYYCKDAEELEGVSIEDWNDDYFLAEEDMFIKCKGTLSVQILIDDKDFNAENYMLAEEDISFDYLELSVL